MSHIYISSVSITSNFTVSNSIMFKHFHPESIYRVSRNTIQSSIIIYQHVVLKVNKNMSVTLK